MLLIHDLFLEKKREGIRHAARTPLKEIDWVAIACFWGKNKIHLLRFVPKKDWYNSKEEVWWEERSPLQ